MSRPGPQISTSRAKYCRYVPMYHYRQAWWTPIHIVIIILLAGLGLDQLLVSSFIGASLWSLSSSFQSFEHFFSGFSFSIKSSTHKSAHVYHLRTNYITKICSHWLWQKNGKPDVSIPSSTSTGIISSWTNKGAPPPPPPTYQTIAKNEEQPLWQKIIWLFDLIECTTL